MLSITPPNGLLASSCAMRRCLVLVWMLGGMLCQPALLAQDQGSLTKDFPKLSAKERSRIAEREQQEAAQDKSYQEVMERAESALRAGALADALKGFEEARALRPYNVYPKVKIEDLRARIRAQAPADTAGPVEEVPVPDTPVTVMAPSVSAPPAALPQAPPIERVPAAPLPPTQPTSVRAQGVVPASPTPGPVPVKVAPPSSSSQPPLPAPPVPGERRYREGRAFVIERTIEGAEGMEVHKCVTHPSGQVFYFKDGRSVDSREWRAHFGPADQ